MVCVVRADGFSGKARQEGVCAPVVGGKQFERAGIPSLFCTRGAGTVGPRDQCAALGIASMRIPPTPWVSNPTTSMLMWCRRSTA